MPHLPDLCAQPHPGRWPEVPVLQWKDEVGASTHGEDWECPWCFCYYLQMLIVFPPLICNLHGLLTTRSELPRLHAKMKGRLPSESRLLPASRQASRFGIFPSPCAENLNEKNICQCWEKKPPQDPCSTWTGCNMSLLVSFYCCDEIPWPKSTDNSQVPLHRQGKSR